LKVKAALTLPLFLWVMKKLYLCGVENVKIWETINANPLNKVGKTQKKQQNEKENV